MLKLILIGLGGACLLLTWLPMSRHEAWWIRIGDFPRVQVALVALATATGYGYGYGLPRWEDKFFISLLLFSVAYQAYSILPYTPITRRQVRRSRRLVNAPTSFSLMAANVLMTNRNSQATLRTIAAVQPDVVILCETDAWWAEQMQPLERDYPYTIKHPLENTYGMLLYSRLPLIEPCIEFLIEEDIPSFHALVKLRSGDEIELRALHPRPPVPMENDGSLERDAELLLVGKVIKDSELPVVVAGDLNDVAWSRTTTLFQKISGLLDPRIGRGFYNTFHAHYPILRVPLDHVFHSRHFRLINMRRLPAGGSDHFPIYISLSYEPDAKITHEKPVATPEEIAEARETIAQAIAENQSVPCVETAIEAKKERISLSQKIKNRARKVTQWIKIKR